MYGLLICTSAQTTLWRGGRCQSKGVWLETRDSSTCLLSDHYASSSASEADVATAADPFCDTK